MTVRVVPTVRAHWLEESLRPEAAREVPRASARLRHSSPGSVEVTIRADDAGAMRAALNTYLGWIDLGLATARVASGAGESGA